MTCLVHTTATAIIQNEMHIDLSKEKKRKGKADPQLNREIAHLESNNKDETDWPYPYPNK